MAVVQETNDRMGTPGTHVAAVAAQPAGGMVPTSGPKLLDCVREVLRSRHCSRRTGQAYRHWGKRFVYFHNVRHPAEMAELEINAFLTHLAVKEKVSAATQNQAPVALRTVLGVLGGSA